ncbi:MAG: ABC transporter substrate-binding protein [Oscillospiraceae bacterium]|nr:ABC transporter substrate-binding protein [Oscillospiraceae bacterium]
MKRNRKAIATILSLLMAVTLLAACGPTTDTGTTPPTGGETATPTPTPGVTPGAGDEIAATPEEGANLAEHIDLILDTQITVLNSTLPGATGNPVTWANRLVKDRLIEHTGPTTLGPGLATRWETDDYVTFRFYLRDDVYFHNGDHFTADDVIFTVEVAKMHPGSPAYNRWRFIETITAVDTYIVEMVLHDVNVDFYFELSNSHASIYNRTAFEANPSDPSWAHVATGPFRVTGFSTNDFLRLERFEDHWGGVAPTKSLTLWTIPEMATRTLMLQTGEAQAVFSLTAEDLDMFNESEDFQVFAVTNNMPTSIGFNNQGDAIMMDRNFRLAVAHAINTADIATVAEGRWALPAIDGNIWGLETQWRISGLEQREHNPELARQYLADSVYNGETIELITANAENIRGAEMIQLQLAEIGINIAIEITDMAGFTAAHTFDPTSTRQMHFFAVAAQPIAMTALRQGFWPENHLNWLNYSNDRVTQLIEELAVTAADADRAAIAREIQEIFYEEMPALAVYFPIRGIPAVNGIGGIRFSPLTFEWDMRGIFWDLSETAENLRPS